MVLKHMFPLREERKNNKAFWSFPNLWPEEGERQNKLFSAAQQ